MRRLQNKRANDRGLQHVIHNPSFIIHPSPFIIHLLVPLSHYHHRPHDLFPAHHTCRKCRKSSSPMSQILRSLGVCSTKLRSRYRKMFLSVSMDEQWSCHVASTRWRKALQSGVWPCNDSISPRTWEPHSPLNLPQQQQKSPVVFEDHASIVHRGQGLV